jgi:hypothetical protein
VYREVRYKSHDTTEVLWSGSVTPDTFEFLGIHPLLGRSITLEDAKPGAPPVFMMSYNLWSKRFGRDPKVLGATLNLNGTPTALIGIMLRDSSSAAPASYGCRSS